MIIIEFKKKFHCIIKNSLYICCMKNIIKYTVLAFLFTTTVFSQTGVELVIPLRTYHLDRNYIEKYADNEGGNIGTIFSITVDKGKLISPNYAAGVFRNSYGDFSTTVQYGGSIKLNKNFKVSLTAGIATGYKKAYRQIYEHEGQQWYDDNDKLINTFGFLEKYGVIPTYNVSITYMTKNNVGLVLNANQYYLNAGIVINLSNIIKTNSGIEQQVAREVDILEVTGSNPVPATKLRSHE